VKKLLLICFIISYWPAAAQTKQISLEDVWQRNTFAAKSVQSVNWMKDGSYYTSLKDGKVAKHQVSDGAVIETLYDPTTDKLDIEDYQLSADEQKILLSTASIAAVQ
jgi:dipeptidyl-peptidase 4